LGTVQCSATRAWTMTENNIYAGDLGVLMLQLETD
jgi:hypothetical protein